MGRYLHWPLKTAQLKVDLLLFTNIRRNFCAGSTYLWELKINNLGCYPPKLILFSQVFSVGQNIGIPIARLNRAGSNRLRSLPQDEANNRITPPKKKNPPTTLRIILRVVYPSDFLLFRLIMKLEIPNQIAAWISPPTRASSGVSIVPPAARRMPKMKPMSAQNLGFEVFITRLYPAWN